MSMKIYLEKTIFINRAPFDKLELNFSENEIAVLSSVNGKGKTTILSHIVDAFFEMAKPHFQNEFESRANKYYRVSSVIHNVDQINPSFVYFRFKVPSEYIDYLDIRNNCTQEQYDNAINIENKIPFSQFQEGLKSNNNIKIFSQNLSKTKTIEVFNNNLLTYFPSYRHEMPGYLNDPYKINLDFKKKFDFSGYLKNPIEVVTGLPQLANWLMDIVLDWRVAEPPQHSVAPEQKVFQQLSDLITNILSSKYPVPLRFGIGSRNLGGARIQIIKQKENEPVYPTIFNLSSGESGLLCLFGELIRQADNNRANIDFNEINGIVLVDEADKHLHIKLQKEILPRLFSLFPNVQFIVSSHSPFLSMGLADAAKDRSEIVDLDSGGISKDPTTTELYDEVYQMMISENERFKEMYQSLETKIKEGTKPIIITEGKTDVKHIKKAKEKLNIKNCDVEFYEIDIDKGRGDSKLKTLLENLAKVQQSRKIIGIFDRDVKDIIDDIEKNGQEYKDYGNNVYAFCIPMPETRKNYKIFL